MQCEACPAGAGDPLLELLSSDRLLDVMGV